LLRACGRAHSLADARAALAAAAASGFPSWSLDLMSGLPGLTRAGWRAALAEAAGAGAPHISVYDLQARPSGGLCAVCVVHVCCVCV
jgi:coproporphyrinogen III oxidase-like Fe-S oxidoreductase